MKPTHWYQGVSGRLRLVTLTETKGKVWTNEPMPVLVSSIDIQPLDTLIGKEVELGQCKGIINGVLSDQSVLFEGKYRGQGVYFDHPCMIQHNHMVKVFWTKGLLPVWQPIFKLITI